MVEVPGQLRLHRRVVERHGRRQDHRRLIVAGPERRDHRRHQTQHAAGALEAFERRPVLVQPGEQLGVDRVRPLDLVRRSPARDTRSGTPLPASGRTRRRSGRWRRDP